MRWIVVVVLALLGLVTGAYAWSRANDAQAWSRLSSGGSEESQVAAAQFGPKAQRDALGAGVLSVALLTGAVVAGFRARRAGRASKARAARRATARG